METTKLSNITYFLRYNIVAGLATAIDFMVLVLLTEVSHLWYMLSGIIGALSGGIVSFIMERNWAFRKRSGNIYLQSIKYLAVWVTSILLNIWGLYLLVEFFHIHYILSKVVVAVIVGLGFNFLTHRYFIFN